MSNYLYAFASFGFLFWIIRNAFYWGELLQKYNYSLRRIKKFLTESSEGSKILFSPRSLLKWVAIFSYPIIIFHENYEFYYHVFITVIYCFELIAVVREIVHDNFFSRRSFTIKSFLIVFFALISGIILFLFPPLDKFLWLVVIDRFIVFLMFIFLIIAALPEEFYWDFKEASAIEKLRNITTLSGIFILGGSGAVVIKHVLVQHFDKKVDVFMSPDDPNEKIIIDAILKQLHPSHTYFISDFGRDIIATIKPLLLLPKPGFFVLHSLPETGEEMSKGNDDLSTLLGAKGNHNAGTILVNADIPFLKKLSVGKKKKFQYYSPDPRKNTPLSVENFTLEKSYTRCVIRYREQKVTVRSPFVSFHSLSVLLPVVGILLDLGADAESISKKLASVRMPDNFLHYSQKKGIAFIHHSLETNPSFLPNFFSYGALYNRTKILILDTEIFSDHSLIEEYIQIGRDLTKHFDYIFLISSPLNKYVLNGIRTGDKECTVVSGTEQMIIHYLLSLQKKGDMVLFYGPRTRCIFKKVTSSGTQKEHTSL